MPGNGLFGWPYSPAPTEPGSAKRAVPGLPPIGGPRTLCTQGKRMADEGFPSVKVLDVLTALEARAKGKRGALVTLH